MKKVLAVSGGVDSVVMLHKYKDDKDVIVAHFDHGIRDNSHEDCLFVEKLAKQYNLPFVFERAELGEKCSEERARKMRYDFLYRIAKEYKGRIYLAHHADDLVESVIINLLRGTGWRGLAPLMNEKIERPLLEMTKADIVRYAAEQGLCFRQDQSNNEENYLRNRVRNWLFENNQVGLVRQMRELAQKQRIIASEINHIEQDLLPSSKSYQRDIFTDDSVIDTELMRQILSNNDIQLTRPAIERALRAVKELTPGKKYSINKEKYLSIKRYFFSVERW